MDPLSIVSASAGVVSAVAKTSIVLFQFSCTFRDAENDMKRIAGELKALAAAVEPLSKTMSRNRGATLDEALLDQIGSTLNGCSMAVEKVEESLEKYQRNTAWTKAKWALYGHDDVTQLCESVKAYNLALSVSLQAVSLNLGLDIKDDTEQIRVGLSEVKLDTKEILARVNSMRQLKGRTAGTNAQIQQWIEDISMLSTYAESTYKATIVDAEDLATREDLTPEKDSPRPASRSGFKKPLPSIEKTKLWPMISAQPRPTRSTSVSFGGLVDIADKIAKIALRVEIDDDFMTQCQLKRELLSAAEMDGLARQLGHDCVNNVCTTESVRSLVAQGANLSYKYYGASMSSLTLGFAIHRGGNECLFTLLQCGVDPAVPLDLDGASIDAGIFHPCPKTPLEYAIKKNNEDAIWALVAAGALRGELDGSFLSPLFAACGFNLSRPDDLNKRLRIIRFLVANVLEKRHQNQGSPTWFTDSDLFKVALAAWAELDKQIVAAYAKAFLKAARMAGFNINGSSTWELAVRTDNAELFRVSLPYTKSVRGDGWYISYAASRGAFDALEWLARPPYLGRRHLHCLVRRYMATPSLESISTPNFLRATTILIGGHGQEILNQRKEFAYESRKWIGKSWVKEDISVLELVDRANTKRSRSQLKKCLIDIAEGRPAC